MKINKSDKIINIVGLILNLAVMILLSIILYTLFKN